jgi:hypothetical protein
VHTVSGRAARQNGPSIAPHRTTPFGSPPAGEHSVQTKMIASVIFKVVLLDAPHEIVALEQSLAACGKLMPSYMEPSRIAGSAQMPSVYSYWPPTLSSPN